MNADRILGPLEALIRRFTAHIDYYARYPAKVIQQQSDGTLDVVPEDTRVPPMQNVPIRYGLPGVKAEVPGGGRVLVGFEGGNPQRPMVELWDFSGITGITFDGSLSPAPIAVEGTSVNCGTLIVAGSATATYVAPGATSTEEIPEGASVITLKGTINDSGNKVKA